jgi:hypothetical protein
MPAVKYESLDVLVAKVDALVVAQNVVYQNHMRKN